MPIFTVRTALPVGGIGKSMQEVEIKQKDVQMSREEIALLECTADELEEMRIADEEFGRAKEASQVMTPYGLPYSPHYLKEGRARQKEPKA